MKNLMILPLTGIALLLASCSQKAPAGFVFVEGGAFVNTRSVYFGKPGTMPNLYFGKYEVTQKEWQAVMGNNPSGFKGDNLPVENVSWYDCLEYCNRRSLKEGLSPYYHLDKTEKDATNTNQLDSIKWRVTINDAANGYRLPTEAEWDYAAGGGQLSKNYIYSGSDKIDDVAWYWQNSGDKTLSGTWMWPTLQRNHNRTRPVGGKKPNELGLYDMSGNVREWCWDRHEANGNMDLQGRVWRGGGWMGSDFCCQSSFRANHEASGKGPDQGLRVCRGV